MDTNPSNTSVTTKFNTSISKQISITISLNSALFGYCSAVIGI